MPALPFFREAGFGPSVICLHANASSSSQWRALMDTLAPRFHVLAVDSYGAGGSPAWPADKPISLRDEVALLEPVFARTAGPVSLVAHSYGAAVALIAALARPDRVQALALYEPTLFSLLDEASPSSSDADGIRSTVAAATAALDAGDRAGAARCFIDYWMSPGAWDGMAEARKDSITASIANLPGRASALFDEPTPLEAFYWLGAPVLYMIGKDSPASARGVARVLTPALPRVQVVEFEGVGHMGPVTHPELINGAVSRFLERHRPLHRSDVLRNAADAADRRDPLAGTASAPS